MRANLDLGVIGNGSFGALIDTRAGVVWCCLPRFDGDPVFHRLLGANGADSPGVYSIELAGLARSEQSYQENTAILVTTLFDGAGNGVRVTDFAPRFHLHERLFRPTTLVRRVEPVAGTPRITVKLRPRFEYGSAAPEITHGSNHIRYVGSEQTLRLTTNAPITYLLAETPFLLEERLSFILGPDETLAGHVEDTAREFQERTGEYWRLWVRALALPAEWQEAVIRAAITLKLCAFEETGAIVAAMTTSIPEAPDSGRNWDYRYCWLRDAFFVVRALNSLSEVDTMERYLRYLNNIISGAELGNGHGHLQPVYGIGLEATLRERQITDLAGYRGMGPVRAGNQAHEHVQHDVYGNAVLAATQAFFDRRLLSQPGVTEFERLEALGERAFALHDQPDAGMWELRTKARVHTASSLMCWACCDRLGKIAKHLDRGPRARLWEERARTIHETLEREAWNPELDSFVDFFGGDTVDASLLLMVEVGFIDPHDARFQSTLRRVEQDLRRGNHMFRYASADDFGLPETAFNICTFWYIDALVRTGRRDEARDIFETMLDSRNHVGLLSEDIDPDTGELWGNYPQTYSLVGIINAAMRLSRGWEATI